MTSPKPLFPCPHEICNYVSKANVKERFHGVHGAVSNHKQTKAPHPCCDPDKKKFCNPDFVTLKRWSTGLVRTQIDPSSFVTCLHSGCEEKFRSMVQRSIHHKGDHSECCKDLECAKCKEIPRVGNKRKSSRSNKESEEPSRKRSKTFHSPKQKRQSSMTDGKIRENLEKCFERHNLKEWCPKPKIIDKFDIRLNIILTLVKNTDSTSMMDGLNKILISDPQTTAKLLTCSADDDCLQILTNFLRE